MKETIDHLNDLKEIRSLMERSSRFISLSGLSGIFAGVFALIGAYLAYDFANHIHSRSAFWSVNIRTFFIYDALFVLIFALGSGIFFTIRNAKKKGQSIWGTTSRRLLINLVIPLMCGAFFCFALLHYRAIGLIAPATLIFYGLALLNASNYTLTDVRYLAFAEIALGMIATVYIGYGLIFWAIGFGVLHIVYGAVMYFKYEK